MLSESETFPALFQGDSSQSFSMTEHAIQRLNWYQLSLLKQTEKDETVLQKGKEGAIKRENQVVGQVQNTANKKPLFKIG
jgi:hypothetical protein